MRPASSFPFPAGLALFALAAVALHFAGLLAGWPLVADLAKPVPAALAAWTLWRWDGSAYSRRLAAGLALSAVGDVLMSRPSAFLGGLAVFLLAHLAYTFGFLGESRRLAPWRALPFVFFAVAGLALMRGGVGDLAAPVALYVAVIAGMMWRAAACIGAPGRPRAARAAALAGAILFAASDLVIGVDRFRAPVPHAEVVIMALYWTAQAAIAGSALVPRVAGRAAR